MPAWLEILLLVVVLVLLALALGGAAGNARRRRAQDPDFSRRVEEANERLAAAAAEDRGWDAVVLERAAREAWGRRHGGEEIVELALVEVTDLPGTERDAAVFHVTGRRGSSRIALARGPAGWSAVEEG